MLENMPCNSLTCFPFLLTWVWYGAKGQQCFMSQTDFVNECTTVYNGVVDGGRCFFLNGTGKPYPTATWYDAWTLCGSKGGTMAQIHTSREFSAIQAYLTSIFGGTKLISIALGREAHLTNTDTNFSMDTQMTRWYDDSINYNPLLTVANTWIQTHQTDDAFAIDNNCYQFYSTFKYIGDCPCNSTYVPLCVVTNPVQNFSLVSSMTNGNCMTETVIKTFTTVPSTSDCGVYCTSYTWCRGYNYYEVAQKCELFSWYYNDTTKFATNSDCYHYAYVP